MKKLLKKINYNIEKKYITNYKLSKFTEEVLNSIKMEEFQDIKNKYATNSDNLPYMKYFDIDKWLVEYSYYVDVLNIKDIEEVSILDIGTGMGYFPFMCQYLGHKVETIDVGYYPMFNEVINFLELKRHDYSVIKYEPLPSSIGKFDIITSFMIAYDNHKEEDKWTYKEWTFFLKNLVFNHLNENGKLYLTMNLDNELKYLSENVEKLFIKCGATIHSKEIRFFDYDKLVNALK